MSNDSETDGPPAHAASLRFSYGDERRARAVERAVAVEVGEIPRAGDGSVLADAGDPDGANGSDERRGGTAARSRAAVFREGCGVEVRIEAVDLVAVRASANTWTRLVSVAESVADAAADAGEGANGDDAA